MLVLAGLAVFPLQAQAQISSGMPAPGAASGKPAAPANPVPGGGPQPGSPEAAPAGAPLLGAGDAESIGKSGEYSYFPADRRDPFAPVLLDGQHPSKENPSLPPLQRLALADLNLIGIVWGHFGYTAMLQAPDGKGYMVRRGTKVGPNNGVVSTVTENAVIIEERFMDIYGKKQVREYVKRLHEKETTE